MTIGRIGAVAALAAGIAWAGGTPEVALRDVDLDGFSKHVAAQKGKPVAVDMWATWCAPCRKSFPKFVALADKLKGKAEFISVSIDKADAAGEAKEYLAKQRATFANFRLTNKQEEIEDKLGNEGVPTYLLYDAAGKVVLRANHFEDLERKLDGLLAGKGS